MASNILHFYLNEHLGSTVMISLSIDDNESFQYNHWNWLHEISELRLLKDDFSIGHIIHTGSIEVRDDGSMLGLAVVGDDAGVIVVMIDQYFDLQH